MSNDQAEQEKAIRKASRRILFGKAAADPRIPGAGTSAAERPERHFKVKVTMNLDGEVLAHFKRLAEQEGQPYQSLINQVLKDFVNGSRPEKMAQLVAELLKNDESFLSEIRKKLGDA